MTKKGWGRVAEQKGNVKRKRMNFFLRVNFNCSTWKTRERVEMYVYVCVYIYVGDDGRKNGIRMEEGRINEIIERRKKKKERMATKLSIPDAISLRNKFFLPPFFFFFPSPSFFVCLFPFHSLIYRVDNSSLSDIQ